MPAFNYAHLDVFETADAILVRFIDHKVLNDHKLEGMAQDISRLADTLGARELRIDFGNVEYLQSSVLGKLIGLAKKVAAGGGRLVLCNISDDVYRAFSVTNLDRLFVIERAKSEKQGSAG